MKKILLTGFEPFQKETLNPSKELVPIFSKYKNLSSLILPVSYSRAGQALEVAMAREEFDFILMLGQAGGRKWIELERVAINMQDSVSPDEDGDLRIQNKISMEGPDAFLNPLPLRDWIQKLQVKNLPVQISFSAGAFVCNSVYYQVFEAIKVSKKNTQALFVHLPYVKEQISGKPEGTPFLPLQTMVTVLEEIFVLIDQCNAVGAIK